MNDYPDRWSQVDVTYHDGEVKTYIIKASSNLAPYLAEQAGRTGLLTLLCGGSSHNIPLSEIREYSLSELDHKPERSGKI